MDRVAIIGLGLIGGSIGLALKQHRPEVEVLGVARRQETADEARRLKAVDRAGASLVLISEADVVVLACPLAVTAQVLEELVPHLAEGARVTDVGSVKLGVVAHAVSVLDTERNPFLGGHPMAGKEVGGIANAEPGLFRGRPWVFTPWPTGAPHAAFDDIVQAVRDIGARPAFLDPREHDRYVALISHVPFLLSAAYLLATGEDDAWAEASELASSGFRDISRLGAGDPAMYSAIAAMNRDEVLRALGGLRGALDQVEAAVGGEDGPALHGLLVQARATRDNWADAHPGLA